MSNNALSFARARLATDPPEESPVRETSPPSDPIASVLRSPGDPETPTSDDLDRLVSDLRTSGHRLLTSDNRLFISDASRLTSEQRMRIKVHKDALISRAEPWTFDATVMRNLPPSPIEQTLIQFLGLDKQRTETNWHLQEPPSLNGIDEIVLNFETDGLEWSQGDRPIGVTIGTLDRKLKRFLPFGFRGEQNLPEERVKEWAQQELRGKRITNVNTRFEVHMAREWGVDLESQGNRVSDVMHYAALLDDHRRKFALDVLAKDYLGGIEIPRVTFHERNMRYYTSEEVADRAEYQVDLVAQLREVMWPKLDAENLQKVRQLEDETIYPVVEMEKNGSLIDLELLDQYQKEVEARYQEIMMEIAGEVGFAFEHSPTGWERLFRHCGLDPSDSYAENIVGAITHPIIQKGHYAAQLASLNSKTFAAYKKIVGSNGILRFDINQLRGDEGGTVSGRFSIGYVQQVPNYDNHSAVFDDQWYPRRLFIPKIGEYLEADAAQIEYRLFSHFANNPTIIAAYQKDPKISFHKQTWAMMQQYKADMLYTHQKSFNFAKMYGARSIKLAMMMGFITAKEGDEIRAAKRWNDPRLDLIHSIEDAYKQMMPEGDFLIDMEAHLGKSVCDSSCRTNDIYHRKFKHQGFVSTLLGRRSRFPKNYKTYIGLNRVLQGTAADIMKAKLVELHRERKYTQFLMRLTVHDAVGGDAQEPDTPQKVAEVLNDQSFDLRVPILWECKVGASWGDKNMKMVESDPRRERRPGSFNNDASQDNTRGRNDNPWIDKREAELKTAALR